MLRVKIIEKLIHINENLIFYPRLKRYYKNNISSIKPIIFDIGSNKGQTIDFFLKIYKNCTIYGFEPNQRLYLLLLEKYKYNSNIKLFNCGISAENGKLLFRETVMDESSTFEELNYNSKYLETKSKVLGVKKENIIKSSYDVDVINLNDFISSEALDRIDIIKIDTEGHEYKCLRGLFKSKLNSLIVFIQLEHHEDDMYLNNTSKDLIEDILKINNYQMHKKIKHGFGNFDEMIYKYSG